jgi:hypothetical protein
VESAACCESQDGPVLARGTSLHLLKGISVWAVPTTMLIFCVTWLDVNKERKGYAYSFQDMHKTGEANTTKSPALVIE